MQVIVSISDDGKITTQVNKEDPTTSGMATTAEPAVVAASGLDAGASPFSTAEVSDETQELSAEALEELDGGAGPQP